MDHKENSSVKKNFAYQMVYELLLLVLPFVTSPYLARVIGANGVGIYSYSYAIAYYFVLFSQLGIKNYGNRAIAQERNDKDKCNKTFTSIFALHAIISVICIVVYTIYIWVIANEKMYAIIMLPYVISGVFDISWFFFGIERFKTTVTTNTVIRIINVICIFVFVRESSDLWKYCLIMSLGMLAGQLVLWIPLKKYAQFVKIGSSEICIHLKPMLVLFVPAIAVSLYKYMDKIMIGTLNSSSQLGFYENAEKVINMPMTVIASFGTVMLPKMSNLAKSKSKESSFRYIKVSMDFVMCLAFGLTFGLSGVASVFSPVFWGKEFIPCGKIIMGLATTIPFVSFANIIRTQYLIPNERDKEYLISVLVGALVNLLINWILIPDLGATGAMIGTICAEIIVCLIQTISVRKELPILDYIKNTAIFFPIGIATFIIVSFIGNLFQAHIYTLFIQVIIGGIFYVAMSLTFFIVVKNEIVLSNISRIKKS